MDQENEKVEWIITDDWSEQAVSGTVNALAESGEWGVEADTAVLRKLVDAAMSAEKLCEICGGAISYIDVNPMHCESAIVFFTEGLEASYLIGRDAFRTMMNCADAFRVRATSKEVLEVMVTIAGLWKFADDEPDAEP